MRRSAKYSDLMFGYYNHFFTFVAVLFRLVHIKSRARNL